MATLVPACSKTNQAEALLERNMELFDQAIDLLEEAKGEQEVAEASLRQFLSKNREEIRSLRSRGVESLKSLAEAEKKNFSELAQKERIKRQTRLENLARTYKDPLAILSLARLAH